MKCCEGKKFLYAIFVLIVGILLYVQIFRHGLGNKAIFGLSLVLKKTLSIPGKMDYLG